jgi:hypothetical protein
MNTLRELSAGWRSGWWLVGLLAVAGLLFALYIWGMLS